MNIERRQAILDAAELEPELNHPQDRFRVLWQLISEAQMSEREAWYSLMSLGVCVETSL
jgi:hypothetical protein